MNKNKKDMVVQLRKMEENKKCLEIRIEELNREIEDLEIKVGLGTDEFINARECDLRELENNYDVIEFYEEQLKTINHRMKKISEKLIASNKR